MVNLKSNKDNSMPYCLEECVWMMMTFNWVIHFNHVIEIFQGETTHLDKSFKKKLNLCQFNKEFIQQRTHELKFSAKMREFQFLCNFSLQSVSFITLDLHLSCSHSFLSIHTLSLVTSRPSFSLSHSHENLCLD